MGTFALTLAAAADRLAENDARPCAIVRGRPCGAIADPGHTLGACSAVWHRATWHRGADCAPDCDTWPRYAPTFAVRVAAPCPDCGVTRTHRPTDACPVAAVLSPFTRRALAAQLPAAELAR